jgi:hypothetical protein
VTHARLRIVDQAISAVEQTRRARELPDFGNDVTSFGGLLTFPDGSATTAGRRHSWADARS